MIYGFNLTIDDDSMHLLADESINILEGFKVKQEGEQVFFSGNLALYELNVLFADLTRMVFDDMDNDRTIIFELSDQYGKDISKYCIKHK